MTLEEYIKSEYAEGKIDFAFRANVYEGRVEMYIHPSGKDGVTTPSVRVRGNEIVWPGTHGRGFTVDGMTGSSANVVQGPWLCEHANENPNQCTCPDDCYCRTHTCKDKPVFRVLL